jgi:xylulokinase
MRALCLLHLTIPMAIRAAAVITPAPPRTLQPLDRGLALGFDFGTSGARCALVDSSGQLLPPELTPAPIPWAERERVQTAADWDEALASLLSALHPEVLARVQRIAISGTSSSMLLLDADAAGADEAPVAASRGAPRMYDFSVGAQAPAGSGEAALELLEAHAPAGHTVRSPTSTLAKLLAYDCEQPLHSAEFVAHQADYIAARLTGATPVSDWHNALKLGYDVRALAWPQWLQPGSPLGERVKGRLPEVVRPGEPVAPVSAAAAARWGLPAGCLVVGGTTDSIAAFLAAGAAEVGDAVTSLGSTMAVKLLSRAACDDAVNATGRHEKNRV